MKHGRYWYMMLALHTPDMPMTEEQWAAVVAMNWHREADDLVNGVLLPDCCK